MKKRHITLLISLSLLLSACGGGGGKPPPKESLKKPPVTVAPEPIPDNPLQDLKPQN